MVCISAISGVYALLAALSSWLRCLLTKPWLFFLTDQVLFSPHTSLFFSYHFTTIEHGFTTNGFVIQRTIFLFFVKEEEEEEVGLLTGCMID